MEHLSSERFAVIIILLFSLQCFDTVAWVTGRTASFLACTHAPLRVRSTIRRHQPAQRTVLSQVDCFVQSEVVGSQVSLDGVQPCDTGMLWWSLSSLVREPLESSWHLCHDPYVRCAHVWKDAVTGLSLWGHPACVNLYRQSSKILFPEEMEEEHQAELANQAQLENDP